MSLRAWLVIAVAVGSAPVRGDDPATRYQAFVKQQARDLRAGDLAPRSRDEWEHRRAALKNRLAAAWGGFPETPCELQPRVLREFVRDGYRVEVLMFQTRPNIWMTANGYFPDKPGRHPAILNVHGHWRGAKQDPVLQARCISAVRQGYVVLCVDAFGAGERGIGPGLGEYHGEMVAATLLPVGLPLSGLQVYENMRAVDYLCSRPEVDPDRIGITGASGGGNQTMYAGAFDERFRCVVPTCSVGNYQAYLSAACCQCEVVPGALTFTEEGDVLALAASRGLMITSATRDAFQFSVDEARKSYARVQEIASLLPGATVRHTIMDSGHDYNQAMREAMLGWMNLHLKGVGDGSPVQEAPITPEDPETLRCFPGDARPPEFVTVPQFAAREARTRLGRRVPAESLKEWSAQQQHGLTMLEQVLGGMPDRTPLKRQAEVDGSGVETITLETEPGLTISVQKKGPAGGPLVVLVDLDAGHESLSSSLAEQLHSAGWMVACPELRATGRAAVARDRVGNAVDHNSAEWGLWIGRPLLGQWAWDVSRVLDAVADADGKLPAEVAVVGLRTGGVVALAAGALDPRITRVATVGGLVSYVTDTPYTGQRLGLMAPAIVRDVGDVCHLAALIAPRPVLIAGAVRADGRPVDPAALKTEFHPALHAYSRAVPEGDSPLRLGGTGDVAAWLKR